MEIGIPLERMSTAFAILGPIEVRYPPLPDATILQGL
jgi:hypothetical protein